MINKLIEEGNDIFNNNAQEGIYGGKFVTGVEYEEWIAKVIFLLEDNKNKIPEFLYKRVIEAAEQAVGNGTEHYDRIVGVLKTLSAREDFQNK